MNQVSWTCYFCGQHMSYMMYADGKYACASCASQKVREAIKSTKLSAQPEDSLAAAIQDFHKRQ